MKRFLTILCALALLAACGAVTVYAEDSAAYGIEVMGGNLCRMTDC